MHFNNIYKKKMYGVATLFQKSSHNKLNIILFY